jgi:hypothetical protein
MATPTSNAIGFWAGKEVACIVQQSPFQYSCRYLYASLTAADLLDQLILLQCWWEVTLRAKRNNSRKALIAAMADDYQMLEELGSALISSTSTYECDG